MDIFTREEKKVEYLELIYDLVFVYMVGLAAAFAVLMIVFRENMWINIFVTVAYVWSIVAVLFRAKNAFEKG